MNHHTNANKLQLSAPHEVIRKPIEELSDDDLIFWLFFERDGLIAMRNANEGNKLNKEIHAAEERFEAYLNAVKDRMRKGGKRH